MARRGYLTVSIPAELVKTIDRLIAEKEFAYSSRAEYVKELVRNDLKLLISNKVINP